MQKGDTTKEKILRKSAELFNIYGYRGCSLSDIMEATNLKKGGIYNHFKNKDEIALNAFDYSLYLVLSRFRKRLDQLTSAMEKLEAIIEVFGSFSTNPVLKGGCPVYNTAVDAADAHPLLKSKAKEGIGMLKKYIEIKIEEGKAAGDFVKGMDANKLSLLIISTMEGAIILARVNNDNACVEVAMEHMKQLVASYKV